MIVDRATSTVELDGRRFPACILVCPPTEGQELLPEWDLTLGGGGRFAVDVFIPMESGVLLMLIMDQKTGRLECGLNARTCEQKLHHCDDGPLWLPWDLHVKNGRIEEGFQRWSNCEEWWLVEHIDRLAAMTYTEPSGPACQVKAWSPEAYQRGAERPDERK